MGTLVINFEVYRLWRTSVHDLASTVDVINDGTEVRIIAPSGNIERIKQITGAMDDS